MSHRVFSKPLSDEGRENYDRIFKKQDEVPPSSGRPADAGSGELADGDEGRVPEAND